MNDPEADKIEAAMQDHTPDEVVSEGHPKEEDEPLPNGLQEYCVDGQWWWRVNQSGRIISGPTEKYDSALNSDKSQMTTYLALRDHLMADGRIDQKHGLEV